MNTSIDKEKVNSIKSKTETIRYSLFYDEKDYFWRTMV